MVTSDPGNVCISSHTTFPHTSSTHICDIQGNHLWWQWHMPNDWYVIYQHWLLLSAIQSGFVKGMGSLEMEYSQSMTSKDLLAENVISFPCISHQKGVSLLTEYDTIVPGVWTNEEKNLNSCYHASLMSWNCTIPACLLYKQVF